VAENVPESRKKTNASSVFRQSSGQEALPRLFGQSAELHALSILQRPEQGEVLVKSMQQAFAALLQVKSTLHKKQEIGFAETLLASAPGFQRKFFLLSAAAGATRATKGAALAVWLAGRTNRRAEIHHGLIKISGSFRGKQAVSKAFDLFHGGCIARLPGDAKAAGEHTQEVPVNSCCGLAKSH